MNKIIIRLSYFIPSLFRKRMVKFYRDILWSIYFKKYKIVIKKGSIPNKRLIRNLIFAWGNEGYSALTDYTETMIDYANKAKGLIFECGCGLSTLLIGVIAKKRKVKMISFEHIPGWADIVKKELVKNKLSYNVIYVRNLVNYGDFDWYDIKKIDIPEIALCILDAPPGNTFGGRKGFLYLFKHKVSSGTIILVDDAKREHEQKMIEEWQKISPFEIVFKGKNDPHAILIIK